MKSRLVDFHLARGETKPSVTYIPSQLDRAFDAIEEHCATSCCTQEKPCHQLQRMLDWVEAAHESILKS